MDGVNALLPLLRKWEKTMEMGDIVFELRIPQKKRPSVRVSASKVKWRLPNANVPLDSSRERRWRRHDFEYRVAFFVLNTCALTKTRPASTSSLHLPSSSEGKIPQLVSDERELVLIRWNSKNFSFLLTFGPSASYFPFNCYASLLIAINISWYSFTTTNHQTLLVRELSPRRNPKSGFHNFELEISEISVTHYVIEYKWTKFKMRFYHS